MQATELWSWESQSVKLLLASPTQLIFKGFSSRNYWVCVPPSIIQSMLSQHENLLNIMTIIFPSTRHRHALITIITTYSNCILIRKEPLSSHAIMNIVWAIVFVKWSLPRHFQNFFKIASTTNTVRLINYTPVKFFNECNSHCDNDLPVCLQSFGP